MQTTLLSTVLFIGVLLIQIDMKFNIDKRYIVIQSLNAIVCYILGVLIVMYFLHPEDLYDFVGASLFAAIIVFFIYFFPRSIYVKDGIISFGGKNCFKRNHVNLTEITQIKYSCKFYNTVLLVTKSGEEYKLHPKDAVAFEDVVRSANKE